MIYLCQYPSSSFICILSSRILTGETKGIIVFDQNFDYNPPPPPTNHVIYLPIT